MSTVKWKNAFLICQTHPRERLDPANPRCPQCAAKAFYSPRVGVADVNRAEPSKRAKKRHDAANALAAERRGARENAPQAKDIPDAEIIEAITATRGRNGAPEWATTWDVLEHLSRWPAKVVMTKLRSCIRRGVIGGCACSKSEPYCRGDFELR
jgi:hypothetical protein